MSSGPFELTFYETDAGTITNILVQPETLTLTFGAVANDPATGPGDPNFPSAVTSRSRKARGCNARRIRAVYTSAASAGLAGLPVTLPWLQAVSEGTAGTYNGEPVQLRTKLDEEIN